MTISLLTLLSPPGKVTNLSHSLATKPETELTQGSVVPAFAELLVPPQHAIKTATLSKSEPEGKALKDKDLSESPPAAVLVNLVTSMLPSEPTGNHTGATLSPTHTESVIAPVTERLTSLSFHSAPSFAAKKNLPSEGLSQGAAQQPLDTRQPSTTLTPTLSAPVDPQEVSHSAILGQRPLNESQAQHPSVAPLSLASSPTFPQLVLHSESAQRLTAPLGSLQWQHDLSQQIIFHKQGQQTIHLKLHPEELGDVKITMTVNKDHAELIMLSNHGQVRSALEAALPHLRQALADNGIQLGNSQVGQEPSSGQQSPSSSHSPTQPAQVVTQREANESVSEADDAPALRRDGSQISLRV
ncbi:flagellar hook-length control protein FliK [Tatumella ptyseos]|uniref:flagellar hook-length control protein FliK n=1 Tax=Tatumella ptyseos TaxID=82987 RepID=UPI0026EF3E32|nr:flagellar hook-length control protein FliK [Tatumella ptyseos]WKX25400.1 flagellar hook-length control protein FliK [Tatumella ptyseos]